MSFFLKAFQRKEAKHSKKKGATTRRRASFSDVHPTLSMKAEDLSAQEDEDTTTAIDYSTSTVQGVDLIPGKRVDNSKLRSKLKKKKSKRSKSGDSGWHSGKDAKLDELTAIESFVKQVAATSKGEKLLQEHLKSNRCTIANHGL